MKVFLFNYCLAYKEKRLDKLRSFYASDAIEQNKPFLSRLSEYRHNFKKIDYMDYRIELQNYSVNYDIGIIRIKGDFHIRAWLIDSGKWWQSSGEISMDLVAFDDTFKVKRLDSSTYADQEIPLEAQQKRKVEFKKQKKTEKCLEEASVKSQKKPGKAQFEPDSVENRSSSQTSHGRLMTIRLPNGMYVTKKVVSMREERYKNVVPQKYDLSCGAASMATILNYFYNYQVDEIDIIKYMLNQGNKEEISQKGFSLLDLKKYALNKGFLADGYKVQLKALRKLKIPAIILFKSGRYSHFVVLKGVKNNKIYIADPAYGNRSMSIKRFEDNWNGIIFIVASRDKQNQTPLPLETTLPAPVLSILRIQQLSMGGFVSFRGPGEF